ncbi:SdiA-regulated domain-containing protein [uncultured Winogradskyella sp.]|uniref:SdiA-regulated domain-containing protein n=1 Tax=uncultured Winogradskyella sp. TaxID=395353 RepID=UPI0026373976|nr:SdiA-regulated domain-containing protein [uncultured Winogradskyella sp.]
MRKYFFIICLLVLSCETGELKVVMDLPIDLNEVSGLETDSKNNLFWMVNDSGNKPILYGLNTAGEIIKAIKIKAKNRDWEDLTTDPKGNIYIGNFGNNDNNSEQLSILKITAKDLAKNKESIKPKVISFTYPEQKKFPPKKSKRHFDCEAFFFYNDSLYLFTKSRAPKKPGKTNLYKLPTTKGNYKAEYIDTFNTCDQSECWVTSADINAKGDKLALLTENSVLVFSKLKGNKFFKSDHRRYVFEYASQKESVAFKNDSTLYIADEYLGVTGGNVYEYKID